MARKIAIENYGIVREGSEGELYLMKKLRKPEGWAEEVAVKLDGKWVVQAGSKYRVLWSDVSKPETHKQKSMLLKILREADLI